MLTSSLSNCRLVTDVMTSAVGSSFQSPSARRRSDTPSSVSGRPIQSMLPGLSMAWCSNNTTAGGILDSVHQWDNRVKECLLVWADLALCNVLGRNQVSCNVRRKAKIKRRNIAYEAC